MKNKEDDDIMVRIITRETPVGTLVPICGGDLAYPAVEIRLQTQDDEVILGVIEYDKHKDTLNWIRWPDLVNDDAEPVRFSMQKEEILKQLRAHREDRSCTK